MCLCWLTNIINVFRIALVVQIIIFHFGKILRCYCRKAPRDAKVELYCLEGLSHNGVYAMAE